MAQLAAVGSRLTGCHAIGDSIPTRKHNSQVSRQKAAQSLQSSHAGVGQTQH